MTYERMPIFLGNFLTFSHQKSQQCGATGKAVVPRGIEISCVPRVSNVPWYNFRFYFLRVSHLVWVVGEVEQQVYLMVGVAAEHAHHVTDVVLIHCYEVVVIAVVLLCKLTCGLAGTADAVFGELASCGGIDGIADFLGTGGCACYLELVTESCVGNEFFHDELGHGATANIAVTYKKYFLHVTKIRINIVYLR